MSRGKGEKATPVGASISAMERGGRFLAGDGADQIGKGVEAYYVDAGEGAVGGFAEMRVVRHEAIGLGDDGTVGEFVSSGSRVTSRNWK